MWAVPQEHSLKVRRNGGHQGVVYAGFSLCITACIYLAGCGGSSRASALQPVGRTAATETTFADSTPAAVPTSTSQATLTSTPYASPTWQPTPTPPAWVPIGRGISRVYLPVPTPGSDEPSYFYVLRIDPTEVTFRVIYDPNEPHKIDEWQGISQAPIVFNSGFFTGQNTPNGRIITDGTQYGPPLDYGSDSVGVRGLLAVTGHRVEIYGLGRTDYNPRGLRFDQAVESYPLLLLPGGQPAFPEETHKRARRTVIGLDQDNQVIVIISTIPLYSLYELAQWLASSNLRLDSALNLDGGRSTGILVGLPDEEKLINSYVPVPIVIGVYPLP
jgi:uncharacterized protein YigE (DUF2233 family)